MPAPDRSALPPLPITCKVAVADLSRAEATPVSLVPSAEDRDALARFLGILAVHRFAFEGRIVGWGTTGWQLTGTLSAAVAQACVVTLDPVTEEIESDVARSFLPRSELAEETDVEIDPAVIAAEDADLPDPFDTAIDVAGTVVEELALALDPYPRRADIDFAGRVHAGPGIEPLTDEQLRPFSGLAALKARLERDKG